MPHAITSHAALTCVLALTASALAGDVAGTLSVDAVELVVQLDAVFGLTLSGSPWVSAKLRTVNTIVDAIMELGDEP